MTTSSKDDAQCPARRSATNNPNYYSSSPQYYRKPTASHYEDGKRTRRNAAPNSGSTINHNQPSSTFVRRKFLENMFPPPPKCKDECVICAYSQYPPSCPKCYPAYYPPPCSCYQEEYNDVPAYPPYPPPCPCPECYPYDN
ncbi:1211_t:CDS:1 [Ambispora gerdemannii]|uniref:1211_t:CDS:1 n=1 Tax=Ambispora gerdemannii TaxID=144530 RepID=A0A9N9G9T9_9GLOM|nr:1211_t:CDS:1 [Ambispora gerdemannii]